MRSATRKIRGATPRDLIEYHPSMSLEHSPFVPGPDESFRALSPTRADPSSSPLSSPSPVALRSASGSTSMVYPPPPLAFVGFADAFPSNDTPLRQDHGTLTSTAAAVATSLQPPRCDLQSVLQKREFVWKQVDRLLRLLQQQERCTTREEEDSTSQPQDHTRQTMVTLRKLLHLHQVCELKETHLRASQILLLRAINKQQEQQAQPCASCSPVPLGASSPSSPPGQDTRAGDSVSPGQ